MRTLVVVLASVMVLVCSAGGALAQGELFLYNWSDYTAPKVIEKFEKETGVKVTLDVFDSNETLLAKLKSGGGAYDIVVPTNNFIPILIEEELIQKINAAELDGYDNIITGMKNPPWDPKNEYTVPWNYGTTSFCLNTDVYSEDYKTFETLFEPPEALQGKIGMFDSSEENICLAQIYLGLGQCNEDPEEMQRVLDLLVAQKPHVKVYSSEGIHERLISEDVAISGCWNGAAIRAREGNPAIEFVYPKEGVLGWADNLVVPTGAPNYDNAVKFIEFMLQPENAAIQSNFTGYANAIKGSEEFMTEELKNAPELHTPEDVPIRFQETCSETAIRLMDKVWTKVKQ